MPCSLKRQVHFKKIFSNYKQMSFKRYPQIRKLTFLYQRNFLAFFFLFFLFIVSFLLIAHSHIRCQRVSTCCHSLYIDPWLNVDIRIYKQIYSLLRNNNNKVVLIFRYLRNKKFLRDL